MACVVLCAYRRAYALDRAAAARRRRLAPGRGRSVKCTQPGHHLRRRHLSSQAHLVYAYACRPSSPLTRVRRQPRKRRLRVSRPTISAVNGRHDHLRRRHRLRPDCFAFAGVRACRRCPRSAHSSHARRRPRPTAAGPRRRSQHWKRSAGSGLMSASRNPPCLRPLRRRPVPAFGRDSAAGSRQLVRLKGPPASPWTGGRSEASTFEPVSLAELPAPSVRHITIVILVCWVCISV